MRARLAHLARLAQAAKRKTMRPQLSVANKKQSKSSQTLVTTRSAFICCSILLA